jgi:hypothetical protein
MPDLRFDTCYRHDDLTRILRDYTEEAPHLVRLESIILQSAYPPICPVKVTSLPACGILRAL